MNAKVELSNGGERGERVIKSNMTLFERFSENKWTYFLGSFYALFGLYNLTGFSVYGWINNFIHRVFLENAQMANVTVNSMVDANPIAFTALAFMAFIVAFFALYLAWKSITHHEYASIKWSALLLTGGPVAIILAAQVFKLIPMSFGQGVELFIIFFAFLAGMAAFLVIGSQAYRNYKRLNVGYFLIPIGLLFLQGFWLFLCTGFEILPRPGWKNIFVSSQVVWTIIFTAGYLLLKYHRRASGQIATTPYPSGDEHHHDTSDDFQHHDVDN